ncbi:MAG: sugar phosphate isomerase/epimerase [Planctomycetota bacterium]|nr:MAG: sugar phosphate isomerase/epimerase [Planctomycetota bacterium]
MPSPALSRRGFLATAAACAAASPLASWAREAAAADLNLGIQLYSLRGYKVDEAMKHARDIGFRFVEFYGDMYPVNSDSAAIAAMKKKLADLGLTASAHGVNGFGGDADANRKVFEFAKAAGIPCISADPSPEAFQSLDELVKEFDVRIAIHNHGPKHRYNKVVDVLKAIEGHDERIGACADLGHYIRSGEKPVEVIRLLKGRLYGIHLKDFKEMQDQTTGVILGKGHLDVPAVMTALVQTGFPKNGALSLEYEENPQNPLDDIRQCYAVASDALAKT